MSQAYSFTEQMKKLGKYRGPRFYPLNWLRRRTILRHLQLSQGEEVFEVERLRLADEVPMMLERTYVPASLFMD